MAGSRLARLFGFSRKSKAERALEVVERELEELKRRCKWQGGMIAAGRWIGCQAMALLADTKSRCGEYAWGEVEKGRQDVVVSGKKLVAVLRAVQEFLEAEKRDGKS